MHLVFDHSQRVKMCLKQGRKELELSLLIFREDSIRQRVHCQIFWRCFDSEYRWSSTLIDVRINFSTIYFVSHGSTFPVPIYYTDVGHDLSLLCSQQLQFNT